MPKNYATPNSSGASKHSHMKLQPNNSTDGVIFGVYFTPDQIARMNEVELTSEFMIVMMEGSLEKSNKIINAFYRDFDADFPDRGEVASRFRSTMDTISAALTDKTVTDLFSNRTMF